MEKWEQCEEASANWEYLGQPSRSVKVSLSLSQVPMVILSQKKLEGHGKGT